MNVNIQGINKPKHITAIKGLSRLNPDYGAMLFHKALIQIKMVKQLKQLVISVWKMRPEAPL